MFPKELSDVINSITRHTLSISLLMRDPIIVSVLIVPESGDKVRKFDIETDIEHDLIIEHMFLTFVEELGWSLTSAARMSPEFPYLRYYFTRNGSSNII